MTEEIDKLSALVDSIREASEITLAKMGDVMPMFFIQLKDDSIGIVSAPWSDDDERDVMINVLKERFKEGEVVRYSFAATAWIASYDTKEWPVGSRPDVMPMNHPDRREVLAILGVEPGRPIISETWSLVREHEFKAEMGEKAPRVDVISGAMTTLLGDVKGGKLQ